MTTEPTSPGPRCGNNPNARLTDGDREAVAEFKAYLADRAAAMTTGPASPAPLSPEREQEIRETHPGSWYAGPWTQDYVDPNGDEPAYCRVVHHESGTTLATLPDFAGTIALFIADAHDAVPELLAELDRVRAERDEYAAALDRARAARSRVSSALIAVAPLLDQPYPDDPRWTPWTRFVRPAMAKLREALAAPAEGSDH